MHKVLSKRNGKRERQKAYLGTVSMSFDKIGLHSFLLLPAIDCHCANGRIASQVVSRSALLLYGGRNYICLWPRSVTVAHGCQDAF